MQVLDLVQSYVSMRIPPYVSFVFYSPVSANSRTHFDQESSLQLTFVYDTSILWQNGIASQVTTRSQSQGELYKIIISTSCYKSVFTHTITWTNTYILLPNHKCQNLE